MVAIEIKKDPGVVIESDEPYLLDRIFGEVCDMDVEIYIKKLAMEEWGLSEFFAEKIYEDFQMTYMEYFRETNMNFYMLRDSVLFRNGVYPAVFQKPTVTLGVCAMHRMIGVLDNWKLMVEPVDQFSFTDADLGEIPEGLEIGEDVDVNLCKVIPAYRSQVEVFGLPEVPKGQFGLTHEDRVKAGIQNIGKTSDYTKITGLPMLEE